MTHTQIVGLSLCLLGLSLGELSAQRPDRRGRDRQRTPVVLESFTFKQAEFDSKSVARAVRYGVYLPKGYDDPANAERTYPLVIWLHGMFENHERFHYRGGAPVLDRVLGEEKIPELIMVGPDGGRSFYINGKESGSYEDLITKDLLGHLEQTYRISKDRKQRAIMGISMGGMGALKIAFKHPELFGSVAAHSSAIFPVDPDDLPAQFKRWGERLGTSAIYGDPIDKELWRAENPLHIASKLDPKKLAGLRVHFDAGTDDRYQFGVSNQMLHNALQKNGVDHTWELIDGGGHAWGSGFGAASLVKSLVFVGEGFTAAQGAERGRAGLQGMLPGTGTGKGSSGKDAPR